MEYTNTKDGNNVGIDVTASYVETVKGFPNSPKDTSYHNHFKIVLTTEHGSADFDFYGSAHDCEKGKTTLTDEDIKDALSCIIDDGIYGAMSFEEFCEELGYDEDSRAAERIHKDVIESLKKLNDIGISDDELYVIINDLHGE